MSRKKPDTDILSAIHDHDINIATRTCYLFGDIDEDRAATFIKNFTYLTGSSNEPVHIEIMSGGGSVDAGMAVYDAIASAANGGIDVIGKVRGEAASIACVIFQACSRRFVQKNATLMHHRGSSSPGDGSPEEQKASADFTNRMYDRIDELVFDRVQAEYGSSLKKFRADTSKSIHMTAEEAVKFGFADFII